MSVVTIENAGKSYSGHAVLKGINLTLVQGKCLALIGHNGAGKTTLMKLILGLVRPTAGRIEVLGVDPAAANKEFRRQLGFLPESVAFHEELTGTDTLAFYARLKGLSATSCPELLARLDCHPRRCVGWAPTRRVCARGSAWRRRCSVRRSCSCSTSRRPASTPSCGRSSSRSYASSTGTGATVVISSHILTELEARTDVAAIMREGQLVAHGDLDTLRREAGLPLTVRAKGDANAIARRLNGAFAKKILPDEREIDIDCPLAQKMALLRTLTTLGDACADVEIRLPSLDDLYLHYTGRKISVSGPQGEAL